MGEREFRLWAQALRRLIAGGVAHWVACPGSRNAPLLRLLVELGVKPLSVIDERSAGYAALGMAQQSGQAAAVVTTSGTAALNLIPSAAEAWFAHTPVLFLTADRPPQWLEQQDNQMVHQSGVFGPHVAASLTAEAARPGPEGEWAMRRVVEDCLWELRRGLPVHLNAPLEEPLYLSGDWVEKPAAAGPLDGCSSVVEGGQELVEAWANAESPVWLVGLNHRFRAPGPPRMGDLLSGMPNPAPPEFWIDAPGCAPDLVVTEVGPHLSKRIKSVLRETKGLLHWHIGPRRPADVFWAGVRSLSAVPKGDWQDPCGPARRAAVERGFELVQRLIELEGPTDHKAVRQVQPFLSRLGGLHLGSSLAVRIAAQVLRPPNGLRCFSNRGASGIDGCLSAAAGHAKADPDRLHLAIVGDVTLHYDLAGLAWAPPNLRVLCLRNGGGAIFRALERPSGPEAFETLLRTPPPRSCQGFCQDAGIGHERCSVETSLQAPLERLLAPSARASVLEVETDGELTAFLHRRIQKELKTAHEH